MGSKFDFTPSFQIINIDSTKFLAIDERISTLAHSFVTGNAIKQGIPVAIIGKTNVGKSTLLNRLLHEDKAIVSDIHGTTRDVIEDTTQINGITFRFIDTAGIRQTDDTIEQLGIQRSYQKLEEATIVLWLLDSQPSAEEINDMHTRCQGKRVIVVQNKIDKGEQPLNIASSSLEPSASKEAPTLPLQATIIRFFQVLLTMQASKVVRTRHGVAHTKRQWKLWNLVLIRLLRTGI